MPARPSPGKARQKPPGKTPSRCPLDDCSKRAAKRWSGYCSRGCRNAGWIEKNCRIPEGAFVGQPVVLRSWQRDIIRGIYNRRTRRAIISYARKNAKTTLAAFLLLLHLCGPEYRPNSQLYSAAQSREQAAILFSLAAKIVRMSLTLVSHVGIRDTAKQLYCEELGTLYRALSAEASTAYGLSPVFVVHDELGQVRGPHSELYEALETASAAQEEPLSVVISTQAPTEADLLSVLIDDAVASNDDRVRLFLWTADIEADPFVESTIRQANPAFGDFQNAEEVLAMAQDARRMPSREAEFRNLILNQRVEASSPFITRSVWLENGGTPDLDWTGRKVFAGLDLSEVSDLTALVLGCPIDGVLHVCPIFWLPEEGLLERSRRDRVYLYDQWARDKYLDLTPGRTIEYDWVAREVVSLLRDFDIQFAFDRWNMRHFRPALQRAGLSEEEIEARFHEFGQGYQSMSPAMRETEALLLSGKIRHGNHPVLNMCAGNAVVKSDPAGNRKMDKKRSNGRIDGMVALVMMVSLAASELDQPENTGAPFVMWA